MWNRITQVKACGCGLNPKIKKWNKRADTKFWRYASFFLCYISLIGGALKGRSRTSGPVLYICICIAFGSFRNAYKKNWFPSKLCTLGLKPTEFGIWGYLSPPSRLLPPEWSAAERRGIILRNQLHITEQAQAFPKDPKARMYIAPSGGKYVALHGRLSTHMTAYLELT